MPDTGWKPVTSARSDSVSVPSGASQDWTPTTSTLTACLSAVGGGSAQVGLGSLTAGARTRWLVAHAPDMSLVPDSATINGIEWRISARSQSDAIIRVDQVWGRKTTTNGANVGSNLASSPQNFPVSFGNVTFGSVSSLGGATWTPSEIKNSGFGVAISIVNIDGEFESQPQIDIIEARVTYTEASGSKHSRPSLGFPLGL